MSFDDLTQLELDFSTLTEEQTILFFERAEYFNDLKPTNAGNGNTKQAPYCEGLVFYTNGNDDAPCQMKHKIHYLSGVYEDCLAEGYTSILFYFNTRRSNPWSPSNPYVCTLLVAGNDSDF